MLTPDMAPEFVTRKRRSVYSTRDRFMATLPKAQSVRLTARQKRSIIEALKDLEQEKKRLETENPKIIKKRFVAKKPKKVSGDGVELVGLLLNVRWSWLVSCSTSDGVGLLLNVRWSWLVVAQRPMELVCCSTSDGVAWFVAQRPMELLGLLLNV